MLLWLCDLLHNPGTLLHANMSVAFPQAAKVEGEWQRRNSCIDKPARLLLVNSFHMMEPYRAAILG